MSDRMIVASSALLFLLCAAGCGDAVSPIEKPPATRMIRFQDDPFTEYGLRPDPAAPGEDAESGAILVEWKALDPTRVGSTRLGGYKLYRSETTDAKGVARDFRMIARLPVSTSGHDTALSDTLVRPNRGYSYYVTVYNRTDESVESDPSDTVRFTLSDRPVPIWPIGAVPAGAAERLRLRFGPSSASGLVAVEVDETFLENDRLVVRHLWRQRAIADFDDPQIEYAGDSLMPGHRYRWRVVKIFPQGEPIGNSSRWVTFLVQ